MRWIIHTYKLRRESTKSFIVLKDYSLIRISCVAFLDCLSVLFRLFWFYKAKFKSKKYESLNPPLSPFQKGELLKLDFNEAKAMLVYPHVPLVLLLLASLLYEHGNALTIISLACMLLLKSADLYKACVDDETRFNAGT